MNRSSYQLILKSSIWFASVGIGLASIAVIGGNVYSYIRAGQLQQERIAEQKAREEEERQAALKAERERQEIAKIAARRAAILEALKNEAATLASAGQWSEALDVLRNYAGEFAADTEAARHDLGRPYRDKIQEIFEADRHKTLDELARMLLARHFGEANALAQNNNKYLSRDTVIFTEDLCRIDSAIAETFQKELNSLLMIKLNSNDLVNAALLRINGDRLVVRRDGVETPVSVADIALGEREKRLAKIAPRARNLYLGLEYHRQGNAPKASDCFAALPEELRLLLQTKTQTAPEQLQHRQAETKLYQILRDHKFITDDLNPDQLARMIETRHASHAENYAAQKEFELWQKTFADTGAVQKHAAISEALNQYFDTRVDYLKHTADVGGIAVEALNVSLTGTPPEAFWDVPPSAGKPLYGKLKFGTSGAVNIVFLPGKIAKAIVAFDDDTDFVGKNAFVISGWTAVTFPIQYRNEAGQSFAEPYAIELNAEGNRLQYRVAGKRAGYIHIHGKPHWVELVDQKATGDYSDRKSVKIHIFAAPKSKSPLKTVAINEKFTLDGKKLKIRIPDGSGKHLDFSER